MAAYTNQSEYYSPLSPLKWYFVFFLTVFFLISPVYVLRSGLPQPSDYFIVLALVPAFILYIVGKKGGKLPLHILVGLFFVGLTFFINMVNYVYYPDFRFILQSVIYIYNFGLFLFCFHMFKVYPEEMRKNVYFVLVIIIFAQFISVEFFPDDKWRQTGLLNNPNQLCYWSFLTLMMIIVLKTGQKLTLLDYGLFFILFYLESKGLSKAGMIVFALTLLIVSFTPQFTRAGRYMLLLLLGAVIYSGISNYDNLVGVTQDIDTFQRIEARLSTFGQDSDDSFDAREYDRPLNFPAYLVLGAGEGAYHRFRERGDANEIHSGLVTVFFSYGILGGILFCTFMGIIFLRLPWYYGAFVVLIFAYGIPHQHLRFSHFWLLLGMLEASRYWMTARGGARGVSFGRPLFNKSGKLNA